jgi:hypothetical protein
MKMTIELPIALPTWNRLLAMHHWQRKKLRDLIHLFVCISIAYGKDWPTWMEYQGKRYLTESLLQEYLQMIRPSSSNKLPTAKKKASKKKPSSR